MKLKFIYSQGHYFFRGGWLGGWVGGVEELRIKPSQLQVEVEAELGNNKPSGLLLFSLNQLGLSKATI